MSDETEGEATPKRALVVDDDSTVVEHVSSILRRSGFSVETAADGLAALSMFRSEKFDAVVCDIRMPKLSGISFLKNLRLNAQSKCRVVMLSSLDDRTVQREAMEAGAVAYLVKPATSKAIVDAVCGTNA
jgi:DNA-binding response OmpR family regulator